MRALDLTTLTQASQSLGAGWGILIRRVLVPNLTSALAGAALLTIAIVMGEFTFANVLLFNTFAVYINYVGQTSTTQAAAEQRLRVGEMPELVNLAEHVRLGVLNGSGPPKGTLAGTVRERVFLGATTRLTVDLDAGEQVWVDIATGSEAELGIGCRVHAGWEAEHARVLEVDRMVKLIRLTDVHLMPPGQSR
jgi:hypothetical protein